ncbi:hypothetical protein BH10BAC2_BH10BAC2_48420 [soil metagenome]
MLTRRLILVIAAYTVACTIIDAQVSAVHEYKKFRVDITGGIKARQEKILDSIDAYGVFLSIEPRYNFTDNLGIGLRFLYGEVYNNFEEEVAARRNNTVLANFIFISNVIGQHRIFEWNVRWFTGVGLGITSFKNITDTVFYPLAPGKKVTSTGTGFAFMPRIGMEIGKLTSELYYYYTVNKGANYFGVSIGVYFGGGRL